MAMTAQEKIDAKREKEYNKKHKRMYKLKPGDIYNSSKLHQLGISICFGNCYFLNRWFH